MSDLLFSFRSLFFFNISIVPAKLEPCNTNSLQLPRSFDLITFSFLITHNLGLNIVVLPIIIVRTFHQDPIPISKHTTIVLCIT